MGREGENFWFEGEHQLDDSAATGSLTLNSSLPALASRQLSQAARKPGLSLSLLSSSESLAFSLWLSFLGPLSPPRLRLLTA